MNQNVNNYTDTWKIRVIQNTKVICTVKECKQVIDEILAQKPRGKSEEKWEFSESKVVVGFDCEGINLGEINLINRSLDNFKFCKNLTVHPKIKLLKY